ncbi:MAG: erythrose-4-phosphate dehydrogenase [Zoogloeaceae bacterium]|nr:erythrose-4-phosphate dehydrogenase [Zoogloeaceae bacterium]
MSPSSLVLNGYGRIGRAFLRALFESGRFADYPVVAINEPAATPEQIAQLTRHDAAHGRFAGQVRLEGGQLVIDGQPIRLLHEREPEAIDWQALGTQTVVDCSGRYPDRAGLMRFLHAGAPRLLVSKPAQSAADVDATIDFGVNHATLTGRERLVSAASCTTNAAVPVLFALEAEFGIESAFLTTWHCAMGDQPVADNYAKSLPLSHSALAAMVPVPTGLARGVLRFLPELAGRIAAKSVRVPTLNVCALDCQLTLASPFTVDAVHAALARAAERFPDLLAIIESPCASTDFNHDPHSASLDTSQTQKIGERGLNLLVWFDNEWGFANRMLDVLCHWQSLFSPDRT